MMKIFRSTIARLNPENQSETPRVGQSKARQGGILDRKKNSIVVSSMTNLSKENNKALATVTNKLGNG